MFALSLLAQTSIETCAVAMARRDEALRPLIAEMRAKRVLPQQLAREARHYPSLREAGYHAAFAERLVAIQRDHPYRDCKAEQSHAGRVQ